MKLGRWFSKRFVVIIEVVGYVIVAIVGLGIVYSAFAYKESRVAVRGTIHASEITVAPKTDAIVISRSVPPGASVAEGDEICRIATGLEAIQRARAHLGLGDIMDFLEDTPNADLRRARETIEEVRRQDIGLPDTEPLTAPAAGRIQFAPDVKPGKLVGAGEPIGKILQFDRFVMEANLGPTDAEKVKIGQIARVTTDIAEFGTIQGTVAAKAEDKNGVTLELQDLSEQVQRYLEKSAGAEQTVLTAQADIIVGRRNVLSIVFARNR